MEKAVGQADPLCQRDQGSVTDQGTNKHRDQGKIWVVAPGQFRSKKTMCQIQEVLQTWEKQVRNKNVAPFISGAQNLVGAQSVFVE